MFPAPRPQQQLENSIEASDPYFRCRGSGDPTGGVSDGGWTAGAGLPTLDGRGPVGALDHSPDEYIEIPSLASRCGLVAGLVAAVDGGL
jgi:acetylornithine deacetylase/succinyl-diaminopimelate desuccinylase-like protein